MRASLLTALALLLAPARAEDANAPLCSFDATPLATLPPWNRPAPRRVIDVVTYAYERDLLRIRVTELQHVVHTHVLSVCDRSFSEAALTLDLNFSALGALADKLVVVRCGSDYPVGGSPWARENYLRDHGLKTAQTLLQPTDVVLFSDVDEMPSAEAVRELLHWDLGSSLVHLRMPVYRWHLGCSDPALIGANDRCGPIALSGSRAAGEPLGHMLRGYGHECTAPGPRLLCSGWHCSSCLPPALINHKYQHFSHADDPTLRAFTAAASTNLSLLDKHLNGCTNLDNSAFLPQTRTRGLPEAAWAADLRYLLPLAVRGLLGPLQAA